MKANVQVEFTDRELEDFAARAPAGMRCIWTDGTKNAVHAERSAL